MKTYCQKCGEATEYSLKAPLCCPFCLSSFTNTTNAVNVNKTTTATYTKTPIITSVKNVSTTDDNEDDTPVSLNINATAFGQGIEIIIPKQDVSKFGEILGTSQAVTVQQPTKRLKDKSKKSILEEFAKEAGSRKQGDAVNEISE